MSDVKMATDDTNKIIYDFMHGLYCHRCRTVWKTTYFETGNNNCDNCLYGEQVLYSESLDAIYKVLEKIKFKHHYHISVFYCIEECKWCTNFIDIAGDIIRKTYRGETMLESILMATVDIIIKKGIDLKT